MPQSSSRSFERERRAQERKSRRQNIASNPPPSIEPEYMNRFRISPDILGVAYSELVKTEAFKGMVDGVTDAAGLSASTPNKAGNERNIFSIVLKIGCVQMAHILNTCTNILQKSQFDKCPARLAEKAFRGM
jgi:hypothetical protein